MYLQNAKGQKYNLAILWKKARKNPAILEEVASD
jgi:hypothetical protein